MKRIGVYLGFVFVFVALLHVSAGAQEMDYRQEIKADKEALKTQRDSVKSQAAASREAEKTLRDQIRAAMQAGDTEKASLLREQLRSMHKENVSEMQADKKKLKEARKELRDDRKTDTNKDGTVDKVEIKKLRKDRDNNPPGVSPDRRGNRGRK